jgi:hypothetical protein
VKKIYIAEFWELGQADKPVDYGYFKNFNEALKAVSDLGEKYRWCITERELGKIDVLKDYRVAFSFDYNAGDILVKAGKLFSAHGARYSCRDISKMAVGGNVVCQDISKMTARRK